MIIDTDLTYIIEDIADGVGISRTAREKVLTDSIDAYMETCRDLYAGLTGCFTIDDKKNNYRQSVETVKHFINLSFCMCIISESVKNELLDKYSPDKIDYSFLQSDNV